MDQFNKLFEDLGVQGAAMGQSLDQVAGSSVDTREVDKLLDQVSAENGLKVTGELSSAGHGKVEQKTEAKASTVSDFEAKLAALKN